MLIMIIGDSACGKSEYAENLAVKLCENRIYAATMKNTGAESLERIQRHRKMRACKGFITAECLFAADLPDIFNEPEIREKGITAEDALVLIEDIPNLLANEMFEKPLAEDADPVFAIYSEIERLSSKTAHTVIVTGNLFSGGYEYDDNVMEYLYDLAGLNRLIAKKSDRVVELVCGIPDVLKERTV